MLKEQNKLILRIHKLLDIGLTMAAFIAAYFIKKYLLPEPFRGLTIAPNYYIVLLIVIIIWFIVFEQFGLYESYRRRGFRRIFWNMAKAVSIGMLIMILCMYIIKITDVSRIMLGIFFFLNIGLLALSKGTAYYMLSRYRKRGFNFRTVLIIGSRERAKEVIGLIGKQLGSGFKVTGAEGRRGELEDFNETDGPVFKIRKDPRIIPYIGTILRKSGLDELPQLINVLKGEMSLVGPRPPIPSEVERYDIWQRRRLSMKPGLTCLWQIAPNRNDITFEEWMRMDLKYIDTWSLGLDFKILLMTVRAVLTAEGR